MRWIHLVMAVAMLILCVGCEGFFNEANPTTIIRFDPVSRDLLIKNNKDVNFKVAKIDASKDEVGGRLIVENLSIDDMSSPVRQANVAQLEAIRGQMEASWAGAAIAMQQVMPYLPIITGNTGGLPPGWSSAGGRSWSIVGPGGWTFSSEKGFVPPASVPPASQPSASTPSF